MIDCESCILKNALISDTGRCYVSCLDLEDALREHDKRIRAEAEKEHNKMCDTCIHKVSKEDIEQIKAEAIYEAIHIGDCSYTDCWDCAFGEADICKLQQLYGQYYNS